MELTYDDPASRLFNILQEGKKLGGSTINCLTAWGKLLEVDTNNRALVYSRVGKVMLLPGEIKEATNEFIPDQLQFFNQMFVKLNSGFNSMNLFGQWKDFINKFDQSCFDSLGSLSKQLAEHMKREHLSISKIQNIKEKIHNLIEDVLKNEDIDDKFKKDLSNYLRRVLNSLDEYQILGAEPTLEAIEATFGHCFTDKVFCENLINTDFGRKYLDFLGDISSALTIYQHTFPMLQTVFTNILKL